MILFFSKSPAWNLIRNRNRNRLFCLQKTTKKKVSEMIRKQFSFLFHSWQTENEICRFCYDKERKEIAFDVMVKRLSFDCHMHGSSYLKFDDDERDSCDAILAKCHLTYVWHRNYNEYYMRFTHNIWPIEPAEPKKGQSDEMAKGKRKLNMENERWNACERNRTEKTKIFSLFDG